MSVNLVQYRVTVGILNNREISRNLKFEEFPIWKWSRYFLKNASNCSSLLFYICPSSLFLYRENVLKITIKFCILIFLWFNIFQIVLPWLCSLLVMLRGDVEVNSGTKKKDKNCLSICHWSLNSISAYDYSKLFLLNSYNSLHKFDIMWLSETYLDSNTPLTDGNLEISGYMLVRSDHQCKAKLGNVCLYYKSNLPLRVINIGYLNECLTFELKVGDKTCNFLVLYRSPSQSQDEFETFFW